MIPYVVDASFSVPGGVIEHAREQAGERIGAPGVSKHWETPYTQVKIKILTDHRIMWTRNSKRSTKGQILAARELDWVTETKYAIW